MREGNNNFFQDIDEGLLPITKNARRILSDRKTLELAISTLPAATRRCPNDVYKQVAKRITIQNAWHAKRLSPSTDQPKRSELGLGKQVSRCRRYCDVTSPGRWVNSVRIYRDREAYGTCRYPTQTNVFNLLKRHAVTWHWRLTSKNQVKSSLLRRTFFEFVTQSFSPALLRDDPEEHLRRLKSIYLRSYLFLRGHSNETCNLIGS